MESQPVPGRAARAARKRLGVALVVILALAGSVVLGLGLQRSGVPPSPRTEDSGAVRPDRATTSPPTLVRSSPRRLDIPAVGIHTRLLRLGLNADGTLEVPWRPLLAGWYEGSPTPGEQGPAVIAGHVDSVATGPAVFHRLGELAVGDTITVSRRDRSEVVFRVSAVRTYARSTFPTAAVYGDTTGPSLRLITCADWDEDAREYVGNLVVFAELVAAGPAPDATP